MATYNAKKLTIIKGEDTYIIDPLQGNESVYVDLVATIEKNQWTHAQTYTYRYTDSHITANAGIMIGFKENIRDGLVGDLKFTKGTGYVDFETDEPPIGQIKLLVRVVDSTTNGVYPIDASIVETDAIIGETTVQGALEDLNKRVTANADSIEDAQDEIALRVKTVNSVPVDENGDVKVNETEFAHQIVTDDAQQNTGEFIFRTTGGEANLSDGPAMLVSISGRSIHTGEIAEELNMTVNMVPREEGQDDLWADPIDRDTFVAYVSVSGTTTLTYTTEWSANPALYGVTLHGTPQDGDTIVIVYVKSSRGLITSSNPSKFISTGWNLYNNADGKKYAKVKKYSTSYGFKVGGTYTALEFSESLSGSRTTITPVDGYFNITADGYVFVTGGDATTYIYMTWTDWTNTYVGELKAYEESTIDIANMDIKFGDSAATAFSNVFSNGLYQVGAVSDEINFSMMRCISRIERLSYTAENIAYAEASGRAYDADEDYIYLVKASEDVYVITTTTGAYTACDHGNEIIEGTSVPLYVSTLYGQNLVDKLRNDVVTKSQDLVNDLTTGGTTKALTAEMGKTLNGKITNKITFKRVNDGLDTNGTLDISSLMDSDLLVISTNRYAVGGCIIIPTARAAYGDYANSAGICGYFGGYLNGTNPILSRFSISTAGILKAESVPVLIYVRVCGIYFHADTQLEYPPT